MLIQYSTNCISKWLSEFGCLTKLSTELFNGMKVYSHLIYCPSQTKCVSLRSIGNESTHVEQNWIIVTILLLSPISVIRNSFVFKQLLGLADFCATEYFSRTARIWEKTGMYNSLSPNRNPNSDYGKWIREERRSNGITVQWQKKETSLASFFCQFSSLVFHVGKIFNLYKSKYHFKKVMTRRIGMPKLKLSLPLAPAKFTATRLPSSSTTGEPLDPCMAGML